MDRFVGLLSQVTVLSRPASPNGFINDGRFISHGRFNWTRPHAGPSYSQQKQAQWPFYQREAQWPFYRGRSNRMALQVSATNCIFAIIPKAGPIAVLSTRGPMAVLSRQKQPDGQTSRLQRKIAFSLLSRTISLSTAKPSYSPQKQAQLPFYQSRSNRMAKPPDFSDKLHFRYYPAGPSYSQQKQAQWPFIKAEATGWPNLQISTTNCIFAIIPHDQFISGRAKLFSAKAGSMAVLSTRANGRFIKSSNRVTPRAALQIWQLRRFRLRPNANKTATEAGWP